MPIGGGTFTLQNKTLPGAYINFVPVGGAYQMGERGIAALPLVLDWGPMGKVFSVEAEGYQYHAKRIFARSADAAELLLVREALKRAKTLLIYRVGTSADSATATVGTLTVTAKYPGTRGNSLKVAALQNVDDTESIDVLTYLDGEEVDRQTVKKTGYADLAANDFVSFSATADLTAEVAVALTGGTNGTVAAASYTAALTAFEVEEFQAIGYPGTDSDIKALVAAFVKRMREDEGKKIVGVLAGYKGASTGIINVKNGVKLESGETLTCDKAVAWVTGATAGAAVNESLTNTAYDGAADVDTKYTKTQYEDAINAGEFVFYPDHGCARVLTDINSYTGTDGGGSWRSNRVIRALDGWANDVAAIFGKTYLGQVTNSETGRQLFKADLVALGKQYEAKDAISEFASEDIAVVQGTGLRDVSVNCKLKPHDSMEKLYMTVVVA